MRDESKRKTQLIDELAQMRQQISTLETQVAQYTQTETEQKRLLTIEHEQRKLAETLHRIGAVLSSSLNYETVLDCILEQIGVLISHDAACIMLIEDDLVRVARWHGYTQFEASDSTVPVLSRTIAHSSSLS